jgi:hypothetical protein
MSYTRSNLNHECVNRPFQVRKHSQCFNGVYNETLSVTIRVNDSRVPPLELLSAAVIRANVGDSNTITVSILRALDTLLVYG